MKDKINKNIQKRVSFCAGCLLSLLVLFACKDTEEEFNLSDSKREILLNETFELIVRGTASYTVMFSDEDVVDYTEKGKTIFVKGIGEGATTMTVTASNGQKKTCFIIVREDELNVDFMNNATPRIEWNTEVPYSDSQDGFLFVVNSIQDAFGGVNMNAETYEYSLLDNPDNYYSVSASGDFSRTGDLSDGLVVICNGDNFNYYKADKVTLKQIKDGQNYLIFYLANNITVRVVTACLKNN